jgi:vacuolar protein sorting-associated protein 72
LCAITNHPARYRDPKTGLPYYNAYAYREIQRLIRGSYKFSGMLGAWVGSGAFAAKGVPERFLHPGAKSEKQKMEESKKKEQEQEQLAAANKVNGTGGQGTQTPAGTEVPGAPLEKRDEAAAQVEAAKSAASAPVNAQSVPV